MSQHTPGPWTVKISVVDAGQRAIIMHRTGVVATTSFSTDTALIEANAHLIAAAPDLLEVCEGFLRLYLEDYWKPIPDQPLHPFRDFISIDKAERAVAKAKEEEEK